MKTKVYGTVAPELSSRLKARAEAEGSSDSEIIEAALSSYLGDGCTQRGAELSVAQYVVKQSGTTLASFCSDYCATAWFYQRARAQGEKAPEGQQADC